MDGEAFNILVVDDTLENIKLVGSILSAVNYNVEFTVNGKEAVEICNDIEFDLILMDIMMPEMDGFEATKLIKENSVNRETPILFITANTDSQSIEKAFGHGAVDYITKPIIRVELLARVKTHLSIKEKSDKLQEYNKVLEQRVDERTRELNGMQEATIFSLASLSEIRDNETGGHIERTQRYVEILALELSHNPKYSELLEPKRLRLIIKSSPLHDIGKVGILDKILLKPGKLTEEEFIAMQKHTVNGMESLRNTRVISPQNLFLEIASEIAYSHHEKWDGSGYPLGLSQHEIPLSAQLMAVADVYDALTSKRVYKEAFEHSKAVEIIKNDSGTHFNPDIVDTFLSVESVFDSVCKLHS